MALKLLDNVCIYLTSKLEKTQTILPVTNSDKERVCSKLDVGDHTYLTLNTNSGVEIVKVTCDQGELFVERGQGDTEAVTAPVNSCLCFKINSLILDEYVGKQACEFSIVTDTPDYILITPPEEDSCEWKVSLTDEFIERLSICCPEDDCDCGDCIVPNGIYENATITIKDGRLCGITNGTNIVYTGGGCCGCSSEE